MKRVHALMMKGLETRLFTGAVLSVSRSDETVFHRPYGTVGGPGTAPVHIDTLFDLASLTKVLSTTPCWMLWATQTPEVLDEPLKRWFPRAPGPVCGITPRLLLAHCSGLPAWRPYYLFPDTRSVLDLARERIIGESLQHVPSKGCIYSDLGFILLAAIIEAEWGETLEGFSRKRLYKPLGLADDLRFRPSAATHRIAFTRPGDAAGLVNDLNARAVGGVSGHAGLFGTAGSVAALTGEILLGMKASGSFFDRSVTHMFCQRANIVDESSRALGFDTAASENPSCGRHFSKDSLGHTGFTGTSVWIDPDRELIVVLLTNRVFMGEADFRIKDFRPILHDAIAED